MNDGIGRRYPINLPQSELGSGDLAWQAWQAWHHGVHGYLLSLACSHLQDQPLLHTESVVLKAGTYSQRSQTTWSRNNLAVTKEPQTISTVVERLKSPPDFRPGLKMKLHMKLQLARLGETSHMIYSNLERSANGELIQARRPLATSSFTTSIFTPCWGPTVLQGYWILMDVCPSVQVHRLRPVVRELAPVSSTRFPSQ